jgi:membrane protease YdiL (CAAX protease family)
MAGRVDPLRIALQVGLYLFFFVLFLGVVVISGMAELMGRLAGSAFSTFFAAVLTNIITLRIYEGCSLADIGFHWNAASARNLAWGLAGGIAAASAVLTTPLLARADVLQPVARAGTHWPIFLFVTVVLIVGAAGEEVLFRGYGFQVLLRSMRPQVAIGLVGIMFGALHLSNPHASWLGLLNTVGFGILFGYAFWRSRDLWFPFGLHFGWNFTLPLFGADVSGIKLGVAGYEPHWSAGPLWSGGEYGPEASVLTSVVLLALFIFIWKAPIRPQRNVLLDEPVER